MRGIFVSGTDTGVGKTVVATGLIRMLRRLGSRVGALKPVETGVEIDGTGPADWRLLAEAAGIGCPREWVAPCVFPDPLAPLEAARRSHTAISIGSLDQAIQRFDAFDWVVVEGAGGLAVPITESLDMAGLAVRWNLPVLIVARPGLGTINHSLLSITYARSRGLEVVGVVLCHTVAAPDDVSAQTNPSLIQELSGVPVLGIIPYRPAAMTARAAELVVTEGLSVEKLLLRYRQLVNAWAAPLSSSGSER
ncbi:MAG: dethiobiotin synthase [Acidobacteria bacterium]|nr:dethiobiotin synthase [Acidobacteriota bacterium]